MWATGKHIHGQSPLHGQSEMCGQIDSNTHAHIIIILKLQLSWYGGAKCVKKTL